MKFVTPKSVVLAALAALAAGTGARARAGDGVIDLTTLANYAHQTVPPYITRDNTPVTNPITDAGATLGRVLFHDRRLSRDDTVSCASCHQQAHGFSDAATASAGVAGTTGRHAMRLINARFGDEVKFFWDERAASLEAQTSQPIQNHVEMGFSGTDGDGSLGDLITKLSALDEYRVLFALTYGDPAITEARMQDALAQFVRSIQSFDSRYDAGRARAGGDNVDFANFTAAENAGKRLFLAGPPAGAGCAGCHQPPEFSIAPNSRNNGVITQIGGGTDLTNTRSPTLRDVAGPDGAPNGGFMHDASLTTLADVIEHYNRIDADNTNLDPKLRTPGGGTQNLNLTQTQKDDLVAFLLTLSGSAVYTDAKLSDPFDAAGRLDVIVVKSGLIAANADGTATVTCQAAAGFSYAFQQSTDLDRWATVATVTPDAAGHLEQTVTPGSGAFYRYVFVVP